MDKPRVIAKREDTKVTTIAVGRARNMDRHAICEELFGAMAEGKSLATAVKERDLVSMKTVMAWFLQDDALKNGYEAALRCRAEVFADELIALADGAVGMSAEGVAAVKLQVNTRQWVISRLLPKKYGDRVTQEFSGPDGGPIQTQPVPTTDWNALRAALQNRGKPIA